MNLITYKQGRIQEICEGRPGIEGDGGISKLYGDATYRGPHRSPTCAPGGARRSLRVPLNTPLHNNYIYEYLCRFLFLYINIGIVKKDY